MGRAGAATEVDNLTAGGFFGWMGREQLGAGRVKDGASISCSRSSRRPLRLGGEGECCSVHLPTLATTASKLHLLLSSVGTLMDVGTFMNVGIIEF